MLSLFPLGYYQDIGGHNSAIVLSMSSKCVYVDEYPPVLLTGEFLYIQVIQLTLNE